MKLQRTEGLDRPMESIGTSEVKLFTGLLFFPSPASFASFL